MKLGRNDYFGIFRDFHGALIADLLGQPTRAEAFYKKAYEQAGTSNRVIQAYGNFLERNGKTAAGPQALPAILCRAIPISR